MSKILLIEDDAALARGYSMRLNSFGYDVIIADCLSKAISSVAKRKPDISLVDINLPDGSGFMFARQLYSNPALENIPVIFMTASANQHFRETAESYGSIAYLEKPIRSKELVMAIAACHYSTVRPIVTNKRMLK